MIREDSILYELKNGNRKAFEQMFRYYYPRLIAYVSSFMDSEIAEDITQDVFLYVWENRQKLYIGKGFHSYLFQSAYTRCLDYIKKNKSTDKYSVHVYNEHAQLYNDLLKDDCHVMDELFTKDLYQRLYGLLEQVPEQRREVFILTYINGMKAKEVAETLDIPQRTVESHLYLTLKYLKKYMSKKDFFFLCYLLSIV